MLPYVVKGILWVRLSIWSWGDYPGLSRAHCTHVGRHKRGRGLRVTTERCADGGKRLEWREQEAIDEEFGWPLEARRAKEADSPLKVPEGTSPANTFVLDF